MENNCLIIVFKLTSWGWWSPPLTEQKCDNYNYVICLKSFKAWLQKEVMESLSRAHFLLLFLICAHMYGDVRFVLTHMCLGSSRWLHYRRYRVLLARGKRSRYGGGEDRTASVLHRGLQTHLEERGFLYRLNLISFLCVVQLGAQVRSVQK